MDWLTNFPDSQILLTGGDGNFIYEYLQVEYPELIKKITLDQDLIFRGLQFVVNPVEQ